jgi:hypothetical protein
VASRSLRLAGAAQVGPPTDGAEVESAARGRGSIGTWAPGYGVGINGRDLVPKGVQDAALVSRGPSNGGPARSDDPSDHSASNSRRDQVKHERQRGQMVLGQLPTYAVMPRPVGAPTRSRWSPSTWGFERDPSSWYGANPHNTGRHWSFADILRQRSAAPSQGGAPVEVSRRLRTYRDPGPALDGATQFAGGPQITTDTYGGAERRSYRLNA